MTTAARRTDGDCQWWMSWQCSEGPCGVGWVLTMECDCLFVVAVVLLVFADFSADCCDAAALFARVAAGIVHDKCSSLQTRATALRTHGNQALATHRSDTGQLLGSLSVVRSQK